MKKAISILTILFLCSTTFAQDEPDSTLNTWIPSLITSLNLSQIAFR
ncbi:MAG: hypothetical protein U5K00_23820 [Melioribacteraceae bacterium]|nr:hypothetical protein [Melioribacteraceae bacterium]